MDMDKTVKRVLIVNSNWFECLGIKQLLEQTEEFEICGMVANIGTAFESAKELEPDIVMIYHHAEMKELELAIQLKEDLRRTKIVLFIEKSEACHFAQAVGKYINGLFVKSCCADDLIFALKSVGSGGLCIDAQLSELFLDRFIQHPFHNRSSFNLTPREHEVLQYIVSG